MVTKKDKFIKIVYLIPSLKVAGAEKICLDLSINLDNSLFNVFIISLKDEIPLAKNIANHANVRVLTLGMPDILNFPWIHLKTIIKLFRIVKKINPDIIHSHLWGAHCVYLYSLIFLKNKPKFLATIHTSGLHYDSSKLVMKYFFFLESFIYRILKFKIVSVSKNVDNMVKKKLYYLSSIQINNGIDINHFHPSETIKKKTKEILGIENKYPILLHVGRAAEVKRQRDIIEAVSILKSKYKELILLLVGRDNKEAYEELVIKLNLSENVKFLGVNENMVEIINSADIGVFPSLYEGLSIALAEQMSCGLPMVISDIPSLREMTNDGKNAILVPTKDPNAIANAVIKIISNPDLAISLGRNARNYVVQNYSLNNMVKSYELFYKKMIS